MTVAKFYMQVELSSAWLLMTNYSLMGVVRVTCLLFSFCRNYIFGTSEAVHFKFRVLTDDT